MMRAGLFMAAITALAISASVVWKPEAHSAQDKPAARPRLEYRVESFGDVAKIGNPILRVDNQAKIEDFRKGLSAIGDQGWELVSAQGEHVTAVYIFKRPK